ncbi:MAG: UdgX family uracil-DNA binding protein [Acidobacteriota bacterium]
MVDVVIAPTLESWREAARSLILQGIRPEEITWREAPTQRDAAPALFDETPSPPGAAPASTLSVPRAFLDLARGAAAHRDPDRWRVLYSALFRIAAGQRDLLSRADDPDVIRLRRLAAEAAEGAPPEGAASFVPRTSDLEELARAAATCRGCDLYRHASRTVFGKGPAGARAVLVGEQPGEQEDLQGAPFVGPAGEVLDRALADANLPRDQVYVTNAVKHFKFVRTPKRRIHQTPNSSEIGACRPWLEAELSIIRPRVLVCLGATAGKALLGPDFRLTRERGRFLETQWAPKLLATYHPSAALRAEDEAGKRRIYDILVSDLKLVAAAVA